MGRFASLTLGDGLHVQCFSSVYSRINRCTDAPIWSALELMNQQSILDTAARLAV